MPCRGKGQGRILTGADDGEISGRMKKKSEQFGIVGPVFKSPCGVHLLVVRGRWKALGQGR